MFLMVYPVEGLAQKNGKRRRGIALPVQKTAVGCGLPFYTVPLPVVNGQPRWDLVKQAAGGAAPRVVAPCGFPVPPGSGLSPYYPAAFAGRELMRAALAEWRRIPRGISAVTLWDETGAGAAEACRLLPLTGEVRIITRHPAAYTEARRRAMTDYGATLVMAAERQAGDVLIHLPAGSPADGRYVLFDSGGEKVTAGDYRPPFRGWAMPAGTDGLAVAGAVAELCGLGERAAGRFGQIRAPLVCGRAVSNA